MTTLSSVTIDLTARLIEMTLVCGDSRLHYVTVSIRISSPVDLSGKFVRQDSSAFSSGVNENMNIPRFAGQVLRPKLRIHPHVVGIEEEKVVTVLSKPARIVSFPV
jgi:hypothetical protein